jgi:YVTN family beta-propeller protein
MTRHPLLPRLLAAVLLTIAATAEAATGLASDGITPAGMAASPDGRTMYVALGRANRVAFVDVATRRVRALVPVGRRAWALAVSADGSRLFVAGGLSNDLTAIDTLSAKALRTIPVGQVPDAVLVDD